ncbi:MAG: type IV pilus twitching motility protein PilT [bacterium]
MINVLDLLKEAVEKGATDLHLTAGIPPAFRIDQRLVPADCESLLPDVCKDLIYSMLSTEQKELLEKNLEVDFAFSLESLARFRGNAFYERGNICCALRRISIEIPTLRELGLPLTIDGLVQKNRGLVLVSGPTGSGKSTTLAAMIDKINMEKPCHIITIEDPIEYIHRHKTALIQQREVGHDTLSFANALKYALRQDPDVILVGEMRDLETISAALTAAETGHLVFSTLHTDSATESINRIIDVFPPHQQQQVRSQISLTLEGVLVQRLLPRASGKGLVLALEVMMTTPAIRAIIRDNRVHEIYGTMQTSQKFGMQTMNMSLYALVKRGLISWSTALLISAHPEELQRMKDKGE